MANRFRELLDAGTPIVADGAMGTMLFAAGLERGSAPELWNVERPEVVRAVHDAYLAAGARLILTNSFGGSRVRLNMHDLGERAAELNRAAAQIARAAADAAPHPAAVAGSIGPTGVLLPPLGDLDFETAVAAFAEQAGALAEGGADVLWIETMADLEEVRAAVEGCRRAAPDLPVAATMSFETRGRTMMGIAPAQAAQTLATFGLAAFGANCGSGPDELTQAVEYMRQASPDALLIAKGNAGLPRLVGGETVYDAAPESMAAYAQTARERGARIIGACCGSTPDHIRVIHDALM